jgi:hypothetical protein
MTSAIVRRLGGVIGALVSDVESWTSAAAHLAQIGAIVVGAIWTYNRFIKQREDFPRATLEQVVTHRELSPEHTYLRVGVKIDNVSNVLLRMEKVLAFVYQVLPVTEEVAQRLDARAFLTEGEREAQWTLIGSYEGTAAGQIEPGEGDEFGFDFAIATEVTTAFIYTYIENVTTAGGSELGWTVTRLYDLDRTSGTQRERVESRPARTK